MKYDGQNPAHAERARQRLDELIRKGAVFDLTEDKPKRTFPQGRYLFAALGFWALRMDGTKLQAEDAYKELNSHLYAEFNEDEFAGIKINHVKHTYELDTAQMAQSIERLRNYAAAYEPRRVYIPSPEEYRMVQQMEMEVQRNILYI